MSGVLAPSDQLGPADGNVEAAGLAESDGTAEPEGAVDGDPDGATDGFPLTPADGDGDAAGHCGSGAVRSASVRKNSRIWAVSNDCSGSTRPHTRAA